MNKSGIVALQLMFILLVMNSPVNALGVAETDYESLTLRLYNEQKWDSLLIVGEEAIKKGYDYYYIRVRVGEAAFYKQRYARAVLHLEKARSFNSGEQYATRLLYKSYHYSNRTDDARWLLRKLNPEFAGSLGRVDKRPLLYLETGPAFTNHVKQFEENRQPGPGTYSEAYLNRNSQYLLAGSNIPVGYRLGMNVAFGVMNFNKNRRVDITFVDSLSGDYSVFQLEAYISPSINITRRTKISPAFRLVNVSLENPLTSDDSLVQMIVGPAKALTYSDYAWGGELSYSAPLWAITGGAWSLKVDKLEYTQATASLFLKPLGNLNLYSLSTVSLKSSENENEYIVYQMIGGKIYRKLWGEAFMSWGDLSGTAEHNLQIIYNAFDQVKTRVGSRLIISINDYLSLSLRYQLFFRKGTELFFPADEPGQIFYYDYINQSITGGIKWKLH
ncbi:MAG: tetratricopeptide repeat protein [Lentimicrobium sp.]